MPKKTKKKTSSSRTEKPPAKSKFEELEFVRIIQPDFLKVVPRHLFEQIEETDPAMIDRIIAFGQAALASPTTLMYGLIDATRGIKGFLWAYVDVVGGVLFVKVFTVDKEYQGGAIKGLLDFLKEQVKGSQIKRIECFSTKPESYRRVGIVKSKQIHLEYEVENGNDDDNTGANAAKTGT